MKTNKPKKPRPFKEIEVGMPFDKLVKTALDYNPNKHKTKKPGK